MIEQHRSLKITPAQEMMILKKAEQKKVKRLTLGEASREILRVQSKVTDKLLLAEIEKCERRRRI